MKKLRKKLRKFDIGVNKVLWVGLSVGLKYVMILFFIVIIILISIFAYKDAEHDISDWGNFSMCMSGIFTSLSVFLVYAAFVKQLSASKEQRKFATRQKRFIKEQGKIQLQTSFNMLFINQLTMQRKLYNKISPDSFRAMHNKIDAYLQQNVLPTASISEKHNIIKSAYDNSFGTEEKEKDVNVYFKFLYHTIMHVHKVEFIHKKDKRDLLQMLQAQMTTHELFCYIINVIDANDENFIPILDDYNFFCDLGVEKNIFDNFIKYYFPKTDFYKIKAR